MRIPRSALVLGLAGLIPFVWGALTELLAPGAPGRIVGIREAIHVPGTLRGEGETQIFLTTANESAAMITVARQAGRRAAEAARIARRLMR